MLISDDGMKLIHEQLPYNEKENDLCNSFFQIHVNQSAKFGPFSFFKYKRLPDELKLIVGLFLNCSDSLSLFSTCKNIRKMKTKIYFLIKLRNLTTLTTDEFTYYKKLCDISKSEIFFKECRQLTHLSASCEVYNKGSLRGRLKISLEEITDALKICSKLKYLSLISFFNVRKLFEHCGNIKGLYISDLYPMTGEELDLIGKYCVNVKYLSINCSILKKDSWVSLVKKLKHLNYLGIFPSADVFDRDVLLSAKEISEIISNKVFIKTFLPISENYSVNEKSKNNEQ